MPSDPLTGTDYPASNYAPNIAQFFQDAVLGLSGYTVPRFATTVARDAAYATHVAAGGAMAAGMLCSVAGSIYHYDGTAWDRLYVEARQRGWTFERTSGTPTDNFSSGSMASLISGTIVDAPLGDWLITVSMCLSAAGTTQGNFRLLAESINQSEDIRHDLTTNWHTFHFSTTFTHTSGDLNLTAQFQTGTQQGTISTAGSRMTASYLGPR